MKKLYLVLAIIGAIVPYIFFTNHSRGTATQPLSSIVSCIKVGQRF